MAKDPAFLFYTEKFLAGVSDLTMEERGQYITMLCLQHQKGRLKEKTISLSVGSISVDVRNKFKIDDDGLLYNETLEEVIAERRAFTESRRQNGLKGGRPKKASENLVLQKEKASENLPINTNIDTDLNVVTRGVQGGFELPQDRFAKECKLPYSSPEFQNAWSRWLAYRKEIKKPYHTASNLEVLLQELAKIGEPKAIGLINHCLANNWANLVFDADVLKKIKDVQPDRVYYGWDGEKYVNGKRVDA